MFPHSIIHSLGMTQLSKTAAEFSFAPTTRGGRAEGGGRERGEKGEGDTEGGRGRERGRKGWQAIIKREHENF